MTGTTRADAFDRTDQVLLSTLAGHASMAIHNAQLTARDRRMTEDLEQLAAERTEALAEANQELTVERDRLNTLFRVTRELSSSLELERALNRTLALINRAMDAQQGFVLLQSPGSEQLVYKAIVGQTPPSPEGEPFPSPRPGEVAGRQENRGIIGRTITIRETICINDLANDPRWQILEGQERWHRSILAAPLRSQQDVKGAVLLCHNAPGHFTPDHQRMLDALSSQIAIAVSNADLFRLLREAADRLGTMLRAQQLDAAKSQAILEGVADGVMVTDATGSITLFNAAAERILQVPRTDLIGRSRLEVPGLFNLAGTPWDELTELWGKGRPEPEQEALYEDRFEIEERVVSMRVAPVTRHGVFEGTVSVFRDITKDVEVDRMKSELISSVSHELRTPMTSIKGYIDLLYNGMAGPISDEQKRFLKIVKSNADRLTLLVNDLLDISRIETGRLKLALQAVDPLSVIHTVIAEQLPKATEKGQSLSSVIQEPLPDVCVDPGRVAQILTNLVDNGISYTPTGGRVTIDAQVVGDLLHIYVQDNGIGISTEDQQKLFTRFFRADAPLVEANSGTGLGLAIVKSIVELHSGEVWVQSALGEGSTFGFSLPLAEPSGEKEAPREFKTIRYRPQDKRILVVEDEIDNANLIAHHLRQKGGYRVHIVRCGRDALDYLTSGEHPTDLITLDLRLPDMNGLEVLRQIKDNESLSGIPVVIISILAQTEDGQRLGARAFLSKPIEEGQLLATVGEILAEKAQVLIAEDDHELADLLQTELERNGFVVITERNGSKVMDRVVAERPELILLDIKLPGMDGYQILNELKKTPEGRDIQVIVITGSVSSAEDKRAQVLDEGAARFLTKPLDIRELIAEIQHVLGDAKNRVAIPES